MPILTSILINLVIGVVLSVGGALISQALSGNRKKQVRGFRGATQTGGTVPLSFMVGTVGVGGKVEYTGTWGNSGETPNAYLVDLLSLGDLPGVVVTGLWVNSAPVTIASTGAVSQGYPVTISLPTGTDNAHLWARFYDGSQSSAPTYLNTAFGADPDRPWQSDMIGTGIPMLALTALVSDEVWTGFPSYLVEVQGIPLYDPREDTTAGGSGSQRWDDPSTWAFTDNPIVIVYNILRGIHDNSLTVDTLGPRIWGGEATAYQLPYDEWAAAMDACDAPINLVGGGTEKRFRAGREIFVNERPADVIGELLIGSSARLSPAANGQFHIIVGVPEAATGSFTDADVIITEATRFDPFPALDQIVNGATGTYMEPAQAWELKETAPYYRSDLEAEDDGRRQLEGLEFPTTFSGTQAQRLLKAIVEDSRRFRRHVVPLPPVFAVYKVLDVLAWTSAENGYEDKLFLITARTVDPFGNVVFVLQEIDPADYDWTPETDERTLTFAPTGPIRPPAQDMTGWFVAPFVDYDATGAGRRYGIVVSAPAHQVDVRAVRIQVWEDFGDGALKFDSDEWPYEVTAPDPQFRVSGPFLLPNHDYKVRAKFVPPDGSGRVINWTDWFEVTMPDIGITYADLPAIVRQMQDFTRGSVESFRDEIMRLARAVVEQDGVNRSDRQELVTRIRAKVEHMGVRITAEYSEAIEVVATDLAAAVTRIETLEAEYSDPETGLLATAEALSALGVQVNGEGGIAESVDALETSFGDFTAGGVVRFQAVSGGTGGWSRYAIMIYASGPDAYVETGLYLEAKSDGSSRIISKGGQHLWLDGSNNVLGLLDSDGLNVNVLKANSIHLGNKGELLSLITAIVADNAISNGDASISASENTYSDSNTVENTQRTLAFTPNGGRVLVRARLYARLDGSGLNIVNFRLRRGGTEVASVQLVIDDTPETTVFLEYIDTSPGTTSVTWTLTQQLVSGGQFQRYHHPTIDITNLKK